MTMSRTTTAMIADAVAECDAILRVDPRNVRCLVMKSEMLILQDAVPQAIDTLRTVLHVAPTDPLVYKAVADVLHGLGRIDDARAALNLGLMVEPGQPVLLVALAQLNLLDPLPKIRKTLDLLDPFVKNRTDTAETIAIRNRVMGIVANLCALIDQVLAPLPFPATAGRPQVVYVLRMVGRLGHLALEPLLVKCLFDQTMNDIIVVAKPRDAAANREVYDIALRDVKLVQCSANIPNMFEAATADIGTRVANGRMYVLESYARLTKHVLDRIAAGLPLPYYRLTTTDLDRGERLRRRMGIPAAAPIVTMFAREIASLDLQHFTFRDADIRTYVPAIQYLVERGYYIVRIGDRKVQPLPDLGPQVIDAPFHPEYSEFVDPYFVAQSHFMISSLAGPATLANVFGVPCLTVNAAVSPFVWSATAHDLCIFKKYYSVKLDRYLSFREIGENIPLVFCFSNDDFARQGSELHENSADEIMGATREMVGRLDGTYHDDDPAYDRAMAAMSRDIHERLAVDPYYESRDCVDFFGMHMCSTKVSHEYIRTFPAFLG